MEKEMDIKEYIHSRMSLWEITRHYSIVYSRKIKKRFDRFFKLGEKRCINPRIYEDSYFWCWRLLHSSYKMDQEQMKIAAEKIALILTLDRQYGLFSEKKLNRLVQKYGTKFGVRKEEN